MNQRSSFPPVFWVANGIEVLERFAYYGIFYGFPIYVEQAGYADNLGTVQTVFVLLSYFFPVFSGTLADRYGFKKMLIASYLMYLPGILLLIFFKSFSGIVMAMLTIGLAAGTFKPLISGTVRTVTDKTNTTIGFGIFYAMVNIGGTFGPFVMGLLRATSWDYAFYSAAASVVVMLLVTILFYKEPPRQLTTATMGAKLKEIASTLADFKFAAFLVLLGVFFWVPFWGFQNICSLYVHNDLDKHALYLSIRDTLGTWFADLLSQEKDGKRMVIAETISNTGYVIMVTQLGVSWFFQRFHPLKSFLFGFVMCAAGFVVLALAVPHGAWLVFPGILLFAVGEMTCSPRISEFVTWLAPKEKAGLYMGSNFLATSIGAFSGKIYTDMLHGYEKAGTPHHVWYVLAVHVGLAVPVFWLFRKLAGDFKTHTE